MTILLPPYEHICGKPASLSLLGEILPIKVITKVTEMEPKFTEKPKITVLYNSIFPDSEIAPQIHVK